MYRLWNRIHNTNSFSNEGEKFVRSVSLKKFLAKYVFGQIRRKKISLEAVVPFFFMLY